MPFTFRRSKKIAGVRVNIGKRGVTSLSFGGRRAGTTIGRRGVSHRVSLPGGLGYRTKATGCVVPLLLVLLVLAVACGGAATVMPSARPPTATQVVRATPTAAPTATPAPTDTAAPTSAPTETVAPIATPAVAGPVAAKGANLRSGPGTNYPVVGGVQAGAGLAVVGRNQAGDWLALAGGAWISAGLVAGAPADLPVAAVIPTVAPTAPVRAAAVPTTRGAPAFSCAGGCATPPDPACAIKGNVNSKGERIYHEPGWRDYNKTNVRPEEGDRWFCTAEEARTAGFRAAQQ